VGYSISLRGKDDVGLAQVLGLGIARINFFFCVQIFIIQGACELRNVYDSNFTLHEDELNMYVK
jgi:hypothetical protein